jgi:hypothetical protein
VGRGYLPSLCQRVTYGGVGWGLVIYKKAGVGDVLTPSLSSPVAVIVAAVVVVLVLVLVVAALLLAAVEEVVVVVAGSWWWWMRVWMRCGCLVVVDAGVDAVAVVGSFR